MRTSRHGSESPVKIDPILHESAQWKREHDEWMRDINAWDRELRHLMLLIYELDKTLPYERKRLAQHMEDVQAHQKLLNEHESVLSQYTDRLSRKGWHGESVIALSSKLKATHTRQRHRHDRVKDAHLLLRQRHHQAMAQVGNLMEQFRSKIDNR